MQFVIVTGMSGAGKSTVLNIFEDLGYYCVDNLPPKLIHNLADFCLEGGSGIELVALGIDIRGVNLFDDLFEGLEALDARHLPYTILFLESADDTLLNRYKETRRTHPLSKNGTIVDGIAEERQLLETVKQRATYIIDTSMMLTRQLRETIVEIYVDRKNFDLMIHVQSFGFKHGMPVLADLVFDVRFLPNPFYVPHLKMQTGLDEPVRDFVMKSEVSQKFLRDLTDMMLFLVPHYIKEGKNQLVIAIGCTGGKHRSVTIARGLHDAMQNAGYSAVINHRDITK
ncbi:MAG: RNase adapter RapZ [Defluviitaleaceae bacterium]|nr:RNase adapter RapZ [Defluviitaleaceae bacterium]